MIGEDRVNKEYILKSVNQETDKISVIIPTHNVEKYIKRCVDSIINQTYKNLEVIIVDDFSTDKTYDMLKHIGDNDSRIKIFRTAKAGVSCARNLALEKSTGKYIMFLDSDDEYDTNMIEIMHEHMCLEGVDMVVCNYTNIYTNENVINTKCCTQGMKCKQDYLKVDAAHCHVIYYGAIWNKIYNGQIIRDNGIRFDEEITLGEDSLFNIEYFKFIKKIYVTQKILYKYYRNNENSLTKKLEPVDTWKTTIRIYDKYIRLYERETLIDVCKNDISFIILSNMIFPVEAILKNSSINSNEAARRMRGIVDNNVVKFALENSKRLSLTDRIIKYTKNIKCYKLMYILLRFKIRMQDKN